MVAEGQDGAVTEVCDHLDCDLSLRGEDRVQQWLPHGKHEELFFVHGRLSHSTAIQPTPSNKQLI